MQLLSVRLNAISFIEIGILGKVIITNVAIVSIIPMPDSSILLRYRLSRNFRVITVTPQKVSHVKKENINSKIMTTGYRLVIASGCDLLKKNWIIS